MMSDVHTEVYYLYLYTEYQMLSQIHHQSYGLFQTVMLFHRALMLQLYMWHVPLRISLSLSSVLLQLELPGTAHRNLHTYLTSVPFLLQLLLLSHVLYVLPARRTLKFLKMVSLFFPNVQQIPTDYTI